MKSRPHLQHLQSVGARQTDSTHGLSTHCCGHHTVYSSRAVPVWCCAPVSELSLSARFMGWCQPWDCIPSSTLMLSLPMPWLHWRHLVCTVGFTQKSFQELLPRLCPSPHQGLKVCEKLPLFVVLSRSQHIQFPNRAYHFQSSMIIFAIMWLDNGGVLKSDYS